MFLNKQDVLLIIFVVVFAFLIGKVLDRIMESPRTLEENKSWVLSDRR